MAYRQIIYEINVIRNLVYNYAKNSFEIGYLNVLVPKDIIKFNSCISDKINSIYLDNKNVTYKDIDEFLKNIENGISKNDVLKYLENNQIKDDFGLERLIQEGFKENIKEIKELVECFEKSDNITFEAKIRKTLKLAKECNRYNGKRVSLDIFLDFVKKREKDISDVEDVIYYIDETNKKRHFKINQIDNEKISNEDLHRVVDRYKYLDSEISEIKSYVDIPFILNK